MQSANPRNRQARVSHHCNVAHHSLVDACYPVSCLLLSLVGAPVMATDSSTRAVALSLTSSRLRWPFPGTWS